jgi:hypothetical protein
MLVSPDGAAQLAATFPALAAQRGPALRVPEAACLRSAAVTQAPRMTRAAVQA